jgi:hypothetical protein
VPPTGIQQPTSYARFQEWDSKWNGMLDKLRKYMGNANNYGVGTRALFQRLDEIKHLQILDTSSDDQNRFVVLERLRVLSAVLSEHFPARSAAAVLASVKFE